MLIGLLFLLMGCDELIGSVEPPKLERAPASLAEVCERPVVIPQRVISQLEVEAYWVRDRANLVTCGERHKALYEFYVFRDSKITGEAIE